MGKKLTLRQAAKQAIRDVAEAGYDGIGYVGSANYQERQNEAVTKLEEAEEAALRIVKRHRDRANRPTAKERAVLDAAETWRIAPIGNKTAEQKLLDACERLAYERAKGGAR